MTVWRCACLQALGGEYRDMSAMHPAVMEYVQERVFDTPTGPMEDDEPAGVEDDGVVDVAPAPKQHTIESTEPPQKE